MGVLRPAAGSPKAEMAAPAEILDDEASRKVAKKLSKKRRTKEGSADASPEKDAPAKKAKKTIEATTSEETSAPETTAAHPSADEFRKEHAIKVTGVTPVPEPWFTFDQTTFCGPLKAALRGVGFSAPTPTQSQSWPMVCTGRDLISIAKTGSGKTVAFLLPAMEALLNQANQKKGRGRPPRVLVLAPTRELAMQIEEDAKKFGRSSGLSTVCCYGGSPKFAQIKGLENGCDILVATPGRLNDLWEMGRVALSGVTHLVLDEADRMLDMGFEPQIRTIIAEVPKERQTLMFTATWPKQVKKLAETFLTNPASIAMGEQGVLHANKNIKQNVHLLDDKEKEEKLMDLLAEIQDGPGSPYDFPKTIIFAGKKHVVQSLADKLWGKGMAVDSLHGDKEQWQRSKVIEAFKNVQAAEPLRCIVATDVAARGLDVKDVMHVINYDFPAGKGGVEDYVHRIGRTGRAGASGTAHTFFNPRSDRFAAPELVTIMKRAEQEVPAELEGLAKRSGGSSFGGRPGGNRGKGFAGRGRGGGGRGRGFKRW